MSQYDDPTGPPQSIGPLAQQLLTRAQTIARLRADLDELAHQTTDTFVSLVERINTLKEQVGEPNASRKTPAAWCWRDLGPRATDELWHQLGDWVAWLRARYPLARKMPGVGPSTPRPLRS